MGAELSEQRALNATQLHEDALGGGGVENPPAATPAHSLMERAKVELEGLLGATQALHRATLPCPNTLPKAAPRGRHVV